MKARNLFDMLLKLGPFVLFVALVSVIQGDIQSSDTPAKPCDATLCKLPSCYCSTTSTPGNIAAANTPQIVMLSFDDALTQALYDTYYSKLFPYKNPDGCEIGLTFFLSHDYADYFLVHDVWTKGHEIADHSITHKTPVEEWAKLNYSGWIDEVQGLRQIASHFANIPAEQIVGFRSPFLQINGDVTMQALHDLNFTWESSMPSRHFINPAIWPFTFDYQNTLSTSDCQIGPCPQDSYPGLWEVPLVDYNGTNNYPCAMIDTCTTGNTTDEVYSWFLSNFQQRYNGNRAPFGVFLHAAWFLKGDQHYEGYAKFLQYLNGLPDVYLVTVSKALQWIKKPTPLSGMKTFWSCTKPTSDCNQNHNRCHWDNTVPGGERWMGTCLDTCSTNYPWLGNPYGN